jgi:tRNA threonylcarbamoyl adenosine modification protein (Sua5/YciO/YrdC/YwlC family)
LEIFDCQEESTRSQGIAAAVSATVADHLVVFPTDTSYALGGDAFSLAAARRIRTIKGLPTTAPLQVLIAETGVLAGIAAPASEDAWKLAEAFWPGPLTLIVPASKTLEWDIGGDSQFVQVRVPKHPVAIELLAGSGPLVTSAARSSQTPIIEGTSDVTDLQHHVAVFLDCGTVKPEGLSTIVDCSSGNAAILRGGPISIGQLVDVLGYMPTDFTSAG